MPSCNTYRLTWVSLPLGVGYLFTAAPAKRSRCSLPWTRGISSPFAAMQIGSSGKTQMGKKKKDLTPRCLAQMEKNPPTSRIPGFDPWVGKVPWRRKWQSTPVLLPGESHGGRSLVDYSPRGRKESDTTERLHSTSMKCTLSLVSSRLAGYLSS